VSLLDYERRFLAYLLGRAPDATGLGDPARLALYRGMAQRRMLGQARAAYRASHTLMGEAAFAALFARYLHDEPPATSALRDAIAAFGQRAAVEAEAERPWLPELLVLESLLFRAAFEPADAAPSTPAELDFHAPPLFVAPLHVLRVRHPVQRLLAQEPPAQLDVRSVTLWVYRDGADVARWRVTSALLGRVSELAAADPSATLTELVRRGAELEGRALDHTLLAELADGLTAATTAGVLLGARPCS
jgi:Putative DNA-binding domain